MEINDLMKLCIRNAMDLYPEKDFEETVHEAFEIYCAINGPYEVDGDDEALELVKACHGYVVECTLGDLVQKGMVEAFGLDEDGEILFSLTELGKERAHDMGLSFSRPLEHGSPGLG